ncbi:hypothetical protein BDZ94DRAFT_1269931 [Collybia nuda]|uniref:F-box domain-containing protein n=1 Tax=Collybia nuda TaxID=64659 RepID=A0A9P6CF93_9AGAR|nr:hypothetical protein BDZ94DRAFT_1269931 [Collybia nuda]
MYPGGSLFASFISCFSLLTFIKLSQILHYSLPNMGEISIHGITLSSTCSHATDPTQPPIPSHDHGLHTKPKHLIVNVNSIITFPNELIQRILVSCQAHDVAAFAQTCRLARSIVYHSSDQYLWRKLFLLHPFDDPRKYFLRISGSNSVPFFDWQHELTRRLKAERSITSARTSKQEKVRALEALISVIQKTPSAYQVDRGRVAQSHDITWLSRILLRPQILDSQHGADASPQVMVYSQLRSYVALSFDYQGEWRTKMRRNESRRFVYDLRNYTPKNSWGPYLDNGIVNWIHIEHLITVLLWNLHDLPNPWKNLRPPLGLEATRPYSAPGTRASDIDWAGVEGTWRRYVCFMDYRDLFAFNFSDVPNGPQNITFFEEPHFREATRLMEVKLHLTALENLRFCRPRKAKSEGLRTSPDPYPPLYFSGSSKSVNGAEALVEGTVRMGHDGVVRWNFASIYSGDVQWSSDGAQIGNIASGFGVVGVWTTVSHDQGDPIGPFWLWKVHDNAPVHLMEYI